MVVDVGVRRGLAIPIQQITRRREPRRQPSPLGREVQVNLEGMQDRRQHDSTGHLMNYLQVVVKKWGIGTCSSVHPARSDREHFTRKRTLSLKRSSEDFVLFQKNARAEAS